MREPRTEQRKENPFEILTLEDVAVLSIPLREINQREQKDLDITFDRNEDERVFFAETSIQFNGENLILQIKKILDMEGLSMLDLRIKKDESFVDVDLIFNRHKDGYKVESYVLKTDPDHLLPAAIGKHLYAKALDTLQALADSMNLSFTDEVHRDLNLSKTPMSKIHWDTIFRELLEQRRYEEKEDGEWTKTYLPKN